MFVTHHRVTILQKLGETRQNVKSRSNVTRTVSMWTICPHGYKPERITSCAHFEHMRLDVPFSLHGFPAPFRRRFPALPCGVITVYPMQTVFRFSRCGARFGNKKSPHNNPSLTIPSGIALVRVCYVAIREPKTCSGSFGRRTEILSVYVILNCWNTLPQKSNCVNKSFESTPLSAACKKK